MSLFKQIFKLLSNDLKKNFWLLLAGMLTLAFVETAAVGVIAFYAASISDPKSTFDAICKYKILDIRLIGYLPVDNPKSMIGFLSVFLILSVLVKNTFSGYITYKIAKFSAKVESFFGQKLLEGFLNKDYLWLIKQNSADLIQKVNWRNHVGRNFITPHMRIICEISMLVTLLLALLFIQPVI